MVTVRDVLLKAACEMYDATKKATIFNMLSPRNAYYLLRLQNSKYCIYEVEDEWTWNDLDPIICFDTHEEALTHMRVVAALRGMMWLDRSVRH